MENLLAVAAAAGEAPQGAGNMLSLFIPLIVVFFVMYWLMIRPQKKAEGKRKEMISNLAKGDRVVSVGGICGQVTDIDEKMITVKVDQSKGVEIKFLKEAIRGVERKKSEEETGQ